MVSSWFYKIFQLLFTYSVKNVRSKLNLFYNSVPKFNNKIVRYSLQQFPWLFCDNRVMSSVLFVSCYQVLH